jgi:predicted nucleic acid-binding protein
MRDSRRSSRASPRAGSRASAVQCPTSSSRRVAGPPPPRRVRHVVLADTSVWVHHFRHGSDRLKALLESGAVATHPFVLGELACGTLARRAETLNSLRALPRVAAVDDGEAMGLVESARLWGSGLGWVDVHLLAAAKLAGATLWTLDAALARAAERLG